MYIRHTSYEPVAFRTGGCDAACGLLFRMFLVGLGGKCSNAGATAHVPLSIFLVGLSAFGSGV